MHCAGNDESTLRDETELAMLQITETTNADGSQLRDHEEKLHYYQEQARDYKKKLSYYQAQLRAYGEREQHFGQAMLAMGRGNRLHQPDDEPQLAQLLAPQGPSARAHDVHGSNDSTLDAAPTVDMRGSANTTATSATSSKQDHVAFQHGFNLGYHACNERQSSLVSEAPSEISSAPTPAPTPVPTPAPTPEQSQKSAHLSTFTDDPQECPAWTQA